MIALGKRTGYDIKQLVDRSTKNFWAASYGQIYPELRRLEQEGLISGRSEPTGGRARTVYELTKHGSAALRDWLAEPPEVIFEVRDESMLKLFFSDFGPPEQRIELLREMRRSHEQTLDQLHSLEADGGPQKLGPRLTLELGLGLNQWIADWCAATEERLAADVDKE
jgi:PadR family transcriptional regulator, regulatory protein AphA